MGDLSFADVKKGKAEARTERGCSLGHIRKVHLPEYFVFLFRKKVPDIDLIDNAVQFLGHHGKRKRKEKKIRQTFFEERRNYHYSLLLSLSHQHPIGTSKVLASARFARNQRA